MLYRLLVTMHRCFLFFKAELLIPVSEEAVASWGQTPLNRLIRFQIPRWWTLSTPIDWSATACQPPVIPLCQPLSLRHLILYTRRIRERMAQLPREVSLGHSHSGSFILAVAHVWLCMCVRVCVRALHYKDYFVFDFAYMLVLLFPNICFVLLSEWCFEFQVFTRIRFWYMVISSQSWKG